MDGGSDRLSKAYVHGVAALFTNKVPSEKEGRIERGVCATALRNTTIRGGGVREGRGGRRSDQGTQLIAKMGISGRNKIRRL